MNERSSKGLTGATFVAGVASALLLVAIGCAKPLSMRTDANGLRTGLSPLDAGKPAPRYVSQESVRRASEAHRSYLRP